MKNTLESKPLISDSDIAKMRELGLTDEEFEILQNANNIAATVEMIPDGKELDKLAQKIRKIFAGKDVGKEVTDFFALAEKDPELFLQMATFYEVLDMHQTLPAATTQKITLADIDAEKSSVQKDEAKKALMELVDYINSLPHEEQEKLKNTFKK